MGPTSGLELANVAATIMSGGTWCPPTPIGQVLDREGKPKSITEPPCEQVVEEGLANILAVGMSKDDTAGTSRAAAAAAHWTRPVIGKTGTNQNSSSATFIGATPQLAGAAMTFKLGGGSGGICDSVDGSVQPHLCGANGNIFGGHAPARTWFGAMSKPGQLVPGSYVDSGYSNG